MLKFYFLKLILEWWNEKQRLKPKWKRENMRLKRPKMSV